MFTGLIEFPARLRHRREQPPGELLVVMFDAKGVMFDAKGVMFDAKGNACDQPRPVVKIGDSVAVNGCCLTVVDVCLGIEHDDEQTLSFEAGPETLRRTNLKKLADGAPVNLELSLVLGQRLGGHFVTGHVDGIGVLDERRDDGDWATFWFRAPPALMRQMAPKGSIAVDGVSLTLVEVAEDRFSVALIPHTLQATTLGSLQVGDEVNLETDVLAKYVERQFNAQFGATEKAQPGPRQIS